MGDAIATRCLREHKLSRLLRRDSKTAESNRGKELPEDRLHEPAQNISTKTKRTRPHFRYNQSEIMAFRNSVGNKRFADPRQRKRTCKITRHQQTKKRIWFFFAYTLPFSARASSRLVTTAKSGWSGTSLSKRKQNTLRFST